MEDYTDVSFGG